MFKLLGSAWDFDPSPKSHVRSKRRKEQERETSFLRNGGRSSSPACRRKKRQLHSLCSPISSNMQIFVKALSGKTITLEVESSCTVKDIVEILEDKIRKKNYTSETISLIFAGKRITHHTIKTAVVGLSVPPIYPPWEVAHTF
jgi:hypothetical protein